MREFHLKKWFKKRKLTGNYTETVSPTSGKVRKAHEPFPYIPSFYCLPTITTSPVSVFDVSVKLSLLSSLSTEDTPYFHPELEHRLPPSRGWFSNHFSPLGHAVCRSSFLTSRFHRFTSPFPFGKA